MNSMPLRSILFLLGISCAAVSCKTTNLPPPQPDQAPVPPSEYGQPGDVVEGGAAEAGQEGGRFGYSGAADEVPDAPEPPKPKPGLRDIREMDASGSGSTSSDSTAETKPPTSSGTKKPPSASQMPFANPVAGNPLVVTLPGANASLGQISVEKYDSSGNPTGEPLKRGTQVQIPDPNNPGKKIFFKVP